MGRRRLVPMHKFLMQFPLEDFADLIQLSKERNTSINTVVRDIVREYLGRTPSVTRTNRPYDETRRPLMSTADIDTDSKSIVMTIGEGEGREAKRSIPFDAIKLVWQYQKRYAGADDFETANNLTGIVSLTQVEIAEVLASFVYNEPLRERLYATLGEPKAPDTPPRRLTIKRRRR